PNHHFPLATRGRSIQKCQLQTSRQVLNKSGLRRIATGKCHRRRVVVRDASRRWDVNLVLPPSDESCKSRAQARRKPEKPELTDICTAGEQRGASTTCRIDRRVCDRNQKQVDQS